jgi:hypothetical protein
MGNSIDANPQLIARRFTSTFAKESLPKGGSFEDIEVEEWPRVPLDHRDRKCILEQR